MKTSKFRLEAVKDVITVKTAEALNAYLNALCADEVVGMVYTAEAVYAVTLWSRTDGDSGLSELVKAKADRLSLNPYGSKRLKSAIATGKAVEVTTRQKFDDVRAGCVNDGEALEKIYRMTCGEVDPEISTARFDRAPDAIRNGVKIQVKSLQQGCTVIEYKILNNAIPTTKSLTDELKQLYK